MATRLAAGEKIASELHEDVAVLFAGVVGRSSTATFQSFFPDAYKLLHDA